MMLSAACQRQLSFSWKQLLKLESRLVLSRWRRMRRCLTLNNACFLPELSSSSDSSLGRCHCPPTMKVRSRVQCNNHKHGLGPQSDGASQNLKQSRSIVSSSLSSSPLSSSITRSFVRSQQFVKRTMSRISLHFTLFQQQAGRLEAVAWWSVIDKVVSF